MTAAVEARAADRKRHGKHYTPPALARFLSRGILRHLDEQNHYEVLDPACGDGELLFAFHKEAIALYPEVSLALQGYDLDPEAVTLAKARALELGIDVSFSVGDFLQLSEDLPPDSFHAIITNPPYVRTQQLGQDAAQLLAARFGLSGRIDLTHPFVTIAPRMLTDRGVLGLLSSNRFLTTKAGANMRAVLTSHMTPLELYDLGDTKLFEAAVLPAITIAGNRPGFGPVPASYSSAYVSDENPLSGTFDLFHTLEAHHDSVIKFEDRTITVAAGELVTGDTPAEAWRMKSPVNEVWLEGIQASTWKTFGEVCKIRVGIKTTADAVFISKRWDYSDPTPETELLLPLITHDDIRPWGISTADHARVLYPYDLNEMKRTCLDMAKFPRAMAYLESHAERLKGRRYVTEGGRAWYEIWVPQQPRLWASPKIVFPDISENARFAYDSSGAVVNGDCYWMSLDDIGSEDLAHLMIGVANSEIAVKFYDAVCGNKLYAGRRRWITQYVSRFPIPDPHSNASRKVIKAVRRLLESTELPSASREAELNQLVIAAFASSSRPKQDELVTHS